MSEESPAYREAAGLLRRLHAAMLAGPDDSPECERLRDEMDPYFRLLTRDEIRLWQELSEALYREAGDVIG
jgi:hypothetical protein